MKVKYNLFPDDIKKKYNLHNKVSPSQHIFIKIKRGMYGLKQDAVLAYDHLKRCLKPFGYHPVSGTVGLWEHQSRPTNFCVCVDDFGIKYWSTEDANHLLNALSQNFIYTTDMEGKHYCGLSLDWHYNLGYVDISMPQYVTKTLKKLNHVPVTYPQHSTHNYVPIQYGKKALRNQLPPRTFPLL